MISINLTIKQKGVIIVCIIENKFAIHKKSSDVKGLNLNYTSSKFNSFGRPYLQKKHSSKLCLIISAERKELVPDVN